ncbi:unnamed protein product [Cercospora beticola]|nr:unnamed protein product [Cercospora beticola]
MSLAATLARDGVRPVSFLPAIKCSTCGIDIEISELADHVCSGQSAPVTAPAPTPAPPPSPPKSRIPGLSNPFKLRQHDASSTPPATGAHTREEQEQTPSRGPTLSKKPSRIALPKINATAANQSFLSPHPKFEAPITPASSGGKFSSLRNIISPMPRHLDQRPPSPELSANLDCAFPPWPTSGSSTPGRPSTSNGRRTPATDRAPSRAESRAASRNEQHNLTVEDPYSYEPKSPRLNGGENVLQRLNTLKSGPFAAKRQGSAESKDGGASSNLRRPSAVEANRPATASSTHSRPTTPATSHSQSEISRIPKKATPPPRPSRPSEEIFSPTFLEQFSAEPEDASVPKTAGLVSNNSYPASPAPETSRSGLQTLAKQRSEPALRSSQRRPSLANPPPSALPLPLRSQSRNALRTDHRIQDAPPVPKPVSQYMQLESSHAPSESDASTISTTHSSNYTDHTYSTRPSPAGSVEALSPLANALSKPEDDEQLRPAGLNIRAQQKPGERAELPRQASPPRAFTRHAPIPPTPAKREDFYALESPMDPNMLPHRAAAGQEPREASFKVPSAQASPLRTRTPVEVPRVDPVNRQLSPMVPQEPSLDGHETGSHSSSHYGSRAPSEAGDMKAAPQGTSQPPPTPEQPQQRRHARRPTMSHKAMCRGCGHMIEGKSVKAADGRLTGRWHKACFVCRTCDAPFLTADFYVINNHPYCEHHYHEQNDSLCHGCNRGIEGQYLETTTSTRQGVVDKKYHPRCFTCSQCRVILTDDYFEINSRVYCERHALAAMRVQAHAAGVQGLYPTDHRAMMAGRRTTRLINPMMA